MEFCNIHIIFINTKSKSAKKNNRKRKRKAYKICILLCEEFSLNEKQYQTESHFWWFAGDVFFFFGTEIYSFLRCYLMERKFTYKNPYYWKCFRRVFTCCVLNGWIISIICEFLSNLMLNENVCDFSEKPNRKTRSYRGR